MNRNLKFALYFIITISSTNYDDDFDTSKAIDVDYEEVDKDK